MKVEKPKLYNARKMRIIKGLTAKEVCEALGISRQCLSQYETGATFPVAKNLQAMANLYGCEVKDLL